MSTADEQLRAMVWAGGFLIELARDTSLPLQVRRQAVVIARHFPTTSEISLSAAFPKVSPDRMSEIAAVIRSAGRDCDHGPLTCATRLEWPKD